MFFKEFKDPVFLLDGNGIVSDANYSAVRWFGDGCVGTSFTEMMAPCSGTPITTGNGMRDVSACIHGHHFTVDKVLRNSGESFVILRGAAGTGNINGEFEQYLPPDAVLAGQFGMLSEADLQKAKFLTTLSHQLRNPLSPIVNAVELLKFVEHKDPSLEPIREVIERQSGLLTRLVDELLDISHMLTGKVPLEKSWISLDRMIHQALELVSEKINSNHNQVNVVLPLETVSLYIDGVRMTQVIGSLLENASQYSPAASKIDITAHVAANATEIYVKDYGQGITSARVPHIFELFALKDQELKRTKHGLGTRLPFAKSIARQHGGDLFMERTVVGEGSEFRLIIPSQKLE